MSSRPHLLKKEQLKKELMANGIPLPKADQRKDFYVNLYKEHLSSQEDDTGSVDEFSSDDEDTPGSSPMGARKKLPPRMPSKILTSQRVKGLPFDVAALSDGDLARQLRQFGGTVGPITESTRHLYQKKLERLLTEECEQTFTSVQQKKASPSKTRTEKFLADLSDANDIEEDEEKVQTLTNKSFDEKPQDALDAQEPISEAPFAERSNGYSLRKRPVSDIESAKQIRSQSSTGNLAGSTGNKKEIEKVTNTKTKKNSKQDENEKRLLSPWVKFIGGLLCFALFMAFLMYFLWREKYLAMN